MASLPHARFTLAGALREPWRPAGYDLTLDGTLDDPTALVTLAGLAGLKLPKLPKLHQIAITARVSDTGGAATLVSGRIGIGPSDFSALVPELQIDDAELTAAPGQKARLSVTGTLRDTPLSARFTLGTAAELARGAPLAIDGSLTLGANRIEARGTLGELLTGAGADLELSGRLHDMARLSPLAFRPLPPLQDVTASAHLRAAPGGWADGFSLAPFSLTLPQGDAAGSFSLTRPAGVRPRIALQLRGARLDLDALSAALGSYRWLPLPDAAPVAALPFARTVRPLIPDHPLDLRGLGLADGSVRLDYGSLRLADLPFDDVSATLALNAGKLTIGPATGQLAGGPVTLEASLDSSQTPPPVTLRLAAPGLSVRALLDAIGSTKDLTGTLALDIRLSAAGRSAHDWAASATGHVAASIVDGTIDNAVLVPPFAGVLRVAHLSPDLLFDPGRSRLRCFALRLDSNDGDAKIASLLLDADRALVAAGGTIKFGDETMDVRLRPTLRIGGPGLVVPLLLRGSLRSPVLNLDQAAMTGEVRAALRAAAAGHRPPGPAIAPSERLCAAALAVVHAGSAGGAPR